MRPSTTSSRGGQMAQTIEMLGQVAGGEGLGHRRQHHRDHRRELRGQRERGRGQAACHRPARQGISGSGAKAAEMATATQTGHANRTPNTDLHRQHGRRQHERPAPRRPDERPRERAAGGRAERAVDQSRPGRRRQHGDGRKHGPNIRRQFRAGQKPSTASSRSANSTTAAWRPNRGDGPTRLAPRRADSAIHGNPPPSSTGK